MLIYNHCSFIFWVLNGNNPSITLFLKKTNVKWTKMGSNRRFYGYFLIETKKKRYENIHDYPIMLVINQTPLIFYLSLTRYFKADFEAAEMFRS